MALDARDVARLVVERGYAPADVVECAHLELGEEAGAIQLLLLMVRRRLLTGSQFGELLQIAEGKRPEGSRIGGYEIVDEIGRGGMGVVYRARHAVLGREVALKVMEAGNRPERRKRFLREGQALARLTHPGIVRVHDFGSEGERCWLAMSFVEGEALEQGLARRRPGRPELAALFESIARALHAAHEAGVIHRDLKPGNVRLDPAGSPVLLDFGLARFEEDSLESLTRTGQVLGTPYYMPPEQFQGRNDEVDRRTDVYALGVMLYQALTGRLPYEADSAVELYDKVESEDPPRPREIDRTIDPALETICVRAMARRKEDRYQSALELASDLGRWQEGRPVTARLRRPPGGEETRRGWGPGLAAGLVGAAIGVSIAGAVLFSRRLVVAEDPAAAEPEAPRPEADAPEPEPPPDPRPGAEEAKRLDESARAHAAEGRLIEAIADLNRAIEIDPGQPLRFSHRAALREGAKDLQGAIADLTQAIRLDPAQPAYHLSRGLLHFKTGEFEKALADHDRAVELDPRGVEPLYARGLFLFGRGEYRGAIRDLEAAIAIDPGFAKTDLYLSRSRYQLGEFELAVESATRAIERSPELAAAYVDRAAAYLELDRVDPALSDLERALKLEPGNAVALYHRGNAHRARGDIEAALADYDRSIELDDHRGVAHWGRGLARRAVGRLAEAIEDLRKASRLSAPSFDLWATLGDVLYEADRRAEALAAYRRAFELGDPASKAAVEPRIRELEGKD